MEEQSKRYSSQRRSQTRHHEQGAPIDLIVLIGEDFLDQPRTNRIGHKSAYTQDHHVEQSLRTGANVLGKILVDEDVNRGEEEGVADAVQYLYEHDERRVLWEERVDRKARSVSQYADNHRGAPTESLEVLPFPKRITSKTDACITS